MNGQIPKLHFIYEISSNFLKLKETELEVSP